MRGRRTAGLLGLPAASPESSQPAAEIPPPSPTLSSVDPACPVSHEPAPLSSVLTDSSIQGLLTLTDVI